ncbi:MAG: hypothetical protein LBC85_10320, partial [Fibromonadaceae bacterium]|nr:hypothetical protein [Fibromonadaceae bacterium]
MELEQTNNLFNRGLQDLTPENANGKILALGMPSDVLLKNGISDKPIRFYGNKLIKKAKKHGFDVLDLKDLPKAVGDPIAIFSGSRLGSFAVLTKIEIGENNVLVIIEMGKGDADMYFNVITSAYPKGASQLEKWIDAGKILYLNKEKAPDYF